MSAGAGSSPCAIAQSKRLNRPRDRELTSGARFSIRNVVSASQSETNVLTRSVGSLLSSGSS